jgi:hypothetical protein
MQKPQEKVSKRELAMQARATHVAEATNAMRGSPSCMGKGQGSLAHEGTYKKTSLDLSSAQGLPPTTAQENAVAFDSRARCRGTVARHIHLFAWENRR